MAKIIVNNPRQVINGGAKKYYFKVKGLGGPKGDQGEKGDTGSRGPQGEPGNAATVYVGSTTTLEVGQDATVENVGTQYNAVLNFGIPQGPRGPQGIQGERGEPGQTGQTGPRGPQGEKGTNATVYVGTTSTLNPGSQATVYNSGTDSNAVLNFGIPRGEKGETGATGATGATGPAGQNFTPTIVDSLPATGNQSNLYLTPKNYTTGTATGNPITISIGEDAGQVTSAQLDGDTFQQSYTGKNLLNCVQRSGASLGITCEVSNTNTLTVNGTSTTSYSDLTQRFDTSITAGTFTFVLSQVLSHKVALKVFYEGGYADVAIEAGETYKTFTLSSNIIGIYVYMATGGAGKTFNETFTVQLVTGSTPDYDFEPFVGCTASPNPDYPQAVNTVTGTQTVEVVGKNLLNPNMLYPVGYSETINGVTYTMMEDGGIKMKGTTGSTASTFTFLGVSWGNTTNQIPLDSSKTYMSSITRPNSTYRWFLRGLVNGSVTSLNSNLDSLAISNCLGITYAMIQVSENKTVDAVVYPQVELGSTATSFVKYSKQTLPIDLGSIELCKLGDYQDYIYKDGDDWKVRKECGKLVVNGSETGWIITESTGSPNYYYARTNAKDGISVSNYYGGYCNNFTNRGIYIQSSDAVNADVFSLGSPSYSLRMLILGSRLSAMTTEALSTWLAANTPTIYYALATPTDTTITDQTLIAQLEAIRTAALWNGANTISNVATGTNLAGDLELSYYEYDPHNRYNKWLWLDINNNYEQLGS